MTLVPTVASTVLFPDFTMFLPICATTPLIVILSPEVGPTTAIVISRFITETLTLVVPADGVTDGLEVGEAEGETVGFGVTAVPFAVTVSVV